MVLLAVLVEDRQAVAAALVGFGAALVSMSVLLPRLVGPLKISAKGFEAELIAAVQEQARASGLSPAETQNVIETARTETDAWAGWWSTSSRPPPPAQAPRLAAAVIRFSVSPSSTSSENAVTACSEHERPGAGCVLW